MTGPRVLVLAGTTEARQLAERLHASGTPVVVSLAGRTTSTERLAGEVRSGGFGGASGLAEFLRDDGITAMVCATHPFAAVMPFHAAAASVAARVPLVRLVRPEWAPVDGDQWTEVADLDSAAEALIALGARRVLLTTGRQELRPFAHLDDIEFTIRSIEPPDASRFARATVVLGRGPFTVEAERALIESHSIDTVVTKNSGGSATAAKLVAAREMGVRVVMVARPVGPEIPTVADVDRALGWLATHS